MKLLERMKETKKKKKKEKTCKCRNGWEGKKSYLPRKTKNTKKHALGISFCTRHSWIRGKGQMIEGEEGRGRGGGGGEITWWGEESSLREVLSIPIHVTKSSLRPSKIVINKKYNRIEGPWMNTEPATDTGAMGGGEKGKCTPRNYNMCIQNDRTIWCGSGRSGKRRGKGTWEEKHEPPDI